MRIPRRKTTHLASDPAQQRALRSPLRLEILGQFTSPGGMSIAQIADRMGRPPSTLYYHVALLERVGLLVRVGERPGKRRPEALYEPVASRIELPASGGSKRQTRGALDTTAAAFRMAVRDMEAALDEGTVRTEGPHRNFYATRVHARLTKQTLAEINEHLRAVENVLAREARRRKLPENADQYCSLTVALLPLRGRGGND